MKAWVNEFQKFIMRGNVIDLAVAVVLGTAFKGVVDNVVAGLFMPIIGLLTGGWNFPSLQIPLWKDSVLHIGLVLQALFSFVIIGFCMFLVVKAMNRLVKKEEVAPVAEPTKSETLLMEIRDLLKTGKTG